jgi:hypothetical protein
MASHHTKDKGDLGVAMVICDMSRNGIDVYIPLSEHQPSDLIAVNSAGRMARVQVKYRSLTRTGVIEVHFRSIYSDSHGYHEKPVDRSQFDCYAVYCPDNAKVYYIRNDEISTDKALTLRVIPPRNGQKKRIVFASQFEGVERIF